MMYKAIVSLLERYYVAWHLLRRRRAPSNSYDYDYNGEKDQAVLRDEASRRMASLMRNDVRARDTLAELLEQMDKANVEGDHLRRNRAIVSIHNMVILGNEYVLCDQDKRDIQAAWYKATTRQELPLPCPRTPPPRSPPMALAFSPVSVSVSSASASSVSSVRATCVDVSMDDDDLGLDFYEESNDKSSKAYGDLEKSLRRLVANRLTQQQRTALQYVMNASSSSH